MKNDVNKTVIYSANFGGYDHVREPTYLPEGCDFVYFTDRNIDSINWNIRRVNILDNDATRTARMHKIMPHVVLPEYDISVWIDANLTLRGDVNELVDMYLKDKNMAAYMHSSLPNGEGRDCVYDEANILMKGKNGIYKDDPEIIKKQIAEYRFLGYPEHNGLINSMVLLRRHNSPDVLETMETWWHEVMRKSKRDQLSFNYAVWKHNLQLSWISDNPRNNEYFFHTPHKQSTVIDKVLWYLRNGRSILQRDEKK